MQAIAAEARNRELQEELTATYKKNSGLAEDLMAAQRRLQIVRESNEAQVFAALLATRHSAGLSASRESSLMPSQHAPQLVLDYSLAMECFVFRDIRAL